ncbi:MAG: group 1 truncated hemoglobin [Rhodospirillaceae bacterium]|nr:group 1 truncated hemoglobin [Rhodospirillaceae bacterium]
MSTLLERIGGETAVNAVVNSFYDKVFTDETLKPFFANTDFEKQRVRQGKFLIQFMAGKMPTANEYMRNAHRKYVAEMGLNDKHFDIVAGHLVNTLKEFNVPQALIDEVVTAVASLRDHVLDRPVKNAA